MRADLKTFVEFAREIWAARSFRLLFWAGLTAVGNVVVGAVGGAGWGLVSTLVVSVWIIMLAFVAGFKPKIQASIMFYFLAAGGMVLVVTLVYMSWRAGGLG